MFFQGGAIRQMDLISAQLSDKSNEGSAQREFIQTVISEFNGSKRRKYMDVAQRYYENDNDVITDKRMVIGRDPENNAILKESKVLSNTRLCHNFMKKLTRQKIGYMLGKPFSLASVEAEDSDAENFFSELDNYFDKALYKLIKNVGRDSIVKGIGWIMVYYDEEGTLRFRRCNSEEVIPLWKDSDHTELDAVVRQYIVEQYSGGNKENIKYVEYYTDIGAFHYIQNKSGELVNNPDYKEQPLPHFSLSDSRTSIGTNWIKIPFIPFKYDPDEQSLLIRIKSLIDDYDRKTSAISNIIADHPNSVTVIKNYDGASKEEFIQNKNEYRTIFVQGDGDAKSLETPFDVVQVDKHIQRLREDIYEFGQGVNTADKDIRDTSGVALRFMYADLDMDCVDWGSEVEWSLSQLIWFMAQDIKARTGKDYTDVGYNIIFNTDVIVNETETVNNCAVSVGVISGDTIAENHPWTKSAKREIDKMREEQEDTLDLESQYGEDINSSIAGQRVSVGQGEAL